MRRYEFETTTLISPERLYDAVTAVAAWPVWDAAVYSAVLTVPVFHGAYVAVRPKRGLRRRVLIETADPGELFVTVEALVFARLRTRWAFSREGARTRVRMSVEMWGPLAVLWRPVAARRAARMEALVGRFLVFAEGERVRAA
jgi:ribosome-associated toxin RatA of RatAB toxin-antitoxin module